jgi:hypothetical protein
VCNNEVVSEKEAGDKYIFYKVGTTNTLNIKTAFTDYFQSLPANAAVPSCNSIDIGLFTDAAATTPFAGTPIITGST